MAIVTWGISNYAIPFGWATRSNLTNRATVDCRPFYWDFEGNKIGEQHVRARINARAELEELLAAHGTSIAALTEGPAAAAA